MCVGVLDEGAVFHCLTGFRVEDGIGHMFGGDARWMAAKGCGCCVVGGGMWDGAGLVDEVRTVVGLLEACRVFVTGK